MTVLIQSDFKVLIQSRFEFTHPLRRCFGVHLILWKDGGHAPMSNLMSFIINIEVTDKATLILADLHRELTGKWGQVT